MLWSIHNLSKFHLCSAFCNKTSDCPMGLLEWLSNDFWQWNKVHFLAFFALNYGEFELETVVMRHIETCFEWKNCIKSYAMWAYFLTQGFLWIFEELKGFINSAKSDSFHYSCLLQGVLFEIFYRYHAYQCFPLSIFICE